MVCLKSKLTKNILIFENGTKTQNCRSLFQQIFVCKTFTVGKKIKACQEQSDLVCGRFIKVFFKTTTCPRRPFFTGPKSGRLIQVWQYLSLSSFAVKDFAKVDEGDYGFWVFLKCELFVNCPGRAILVWPC